MYSLWKRRTLEDVPHPLIYTSPKPQADTLLRSDSVAAALLLTKVHGVDVATVHGVDETEVHGVDVTKVHGVDVTKVHAVAELPYLKRRLERDQRS